LISGIAQDESNAFFGRLGRKGGVGEQNDQRTKREQACEVVPHGGTRRQLGHDANAIKYALNGI
jgi:hypothetical protein